MKVMVTPTLDTTPDVESVSIVKGDSPGDVVVVFELVTGAKVRLIMTAEETTKVQDGIRQVQQPIVYFSV